VMAVAAGKSAEERRWVKMSEMANELDSRPLIDKVLQSADDTISVY